MTAPIRLTSRFYRRWRPYHWLSHTQESSKWRCSCHYPTRDATVEGHIIGRFFSVRCVNLLMNYHSAFRQGTPSSQSALPDSSLAPGMEDDPWTVLDYKYAKRTRIPSHFKFAFISRRTRYPIFIQQESRKSLLYKFPFEMNSSRSIFEVHSQVAN